MHVAEVGAGNHVIKHTHAVREGEKNCKFVPQKKKERHLKIRRGRGGGDDGDGVEEDSLARNYQGALVQGMR